MIRHRRRPTAGTEQFPHDWVLAIADDAVVAECEPYQIVERRDLAQIGLRCVAGQRVAGYVGPPLPDQFHPAAHSGLRCGARRRPGFVVAFAFLRQLQRPQPHRSVAVDAGHQRCAPCLIDDAVHRLVDQIVDFLDLALDLVGVDLGQPPVARVCDHSEECLGLADRNVVQSNINKTVAERCVEPQRSHVRCIGRRLL